MWSPVYIPQYKKRKKHEEIPYYKGKKEGLRKIYFENGNLSKSFKAYDKVTAKKNGIEVNAYENGFAIVVKDGVTCLVFDVDESTYIDSKVSLMVYAYDSINSLLGIKNIA